MTEYFSIKNILIEASSMRENTRRGAFAITFSFLPAKDLFGMGEMLITPARIFGVKGQSSKTGLLLSLLLVLVSLV